MMRTLQIEYIDIRSALFIGVAMATVIVLLTWILFAGFIGVSNLLRLRDYVDLIFGSAEPMATLPSPYLIIVTSIVAISLTGTVFVNVYNLTAALSGGIRLDIKLIDNRPLAFLDDMPQKTAHAEPEHEVPQILEIKKLMIIPAFITGALALGGGWVMGALLFQIAGAGYLDSLGAAWNEFTFYVTLGGVGGLVLTRFYNSPVRVIGGFRAEVASRLVQHAGVKSKRGLAGRRVRYRIDSIDVLSTSTISMVVWLMLWGLLWLYFAFSDVTGVSIWGADQAIRGIVYDQAAAGLLLALFAGFAIVPVVWGYNYLSAQFGGLEIEGQLSDWKPASDGSDASAYFEKGN